MAITLIDDSQRKAARVVGLSYLLAMPPALFARFYVFPQLIVRDHAAQTVRNVMAHEGLFRLGIAANPIAFLVDIELIGDYPGPRDFDVVCVSSQVEGDFSRLLSIQINHVTVPNETRAQLTQALCKHLGIQYITPDDDDTDPYFVWLISPGGAPSRVGLDPVAFDEDRYVIARRVQLLSIRFDEDHEWWVSRRVFERLFLFALAHGHLEPPLKEWRHVADANGGRSARGPRTHRRAERTVVSSGACSLVVAG